MLSTSCTVAKSAKFQTDEQSSARRRCRRGDDGGDGAQNLQTWKIALLGWAEAEERILEPRLAREELFFMDKKSALSRALLKLDIFL